MDNSPFKLHTYFLRAVRLYRPKENWNFIQKLFYGLYRYVWILFMYGTIVLTILDIFWREEAVNISDVAINIMYLGLYCSITSRATVFGLDFTTVDKLVKVVAEEFRPSSTLAFRPMTMDKSMKHARKLTLVWMVFCILSGDFMILGPLLRTVRSIPIQIWLWYDWSAGNNFYLTLLLQYIALYFMVTSFSILDMVNSTFMILTAGQIDILGYDFNNVFNNALAKQGCSEEEVVEYVAYVNKNEENRSSSAQKINKILETPQFKSDITANLKYCVKHHQKMLNFLQDFENYLSPYLIVEVNFIFTYMIFMLFIFVTTDNQSIYLALSQYLSGSVGQMFILTFLGEQLITSVEAMRESLYDVPWYLCDKRFQTNIKIVQVRMLKPVRITAGKLLMMNLETFLEFMKKAFSFFTVLRQMK